jgi:hypothetical protein
MLSLDKDISKCALQLAGESPSKLEAPSSKFPVLESNRSSMLSAVCVIKAVTLVVYVAPRSIGFAK